MKRRHKLFLEIIAELHNYNIQSVAEHSRVSSVTLYNWMQGKVYAPRTDTLFRVADTLGLDICWYKKKAKAA